MTDGYEVHMTGLKMSLLTNLSDGLSDRTPPVTSVIRSTLFLPQDPHPPITSCHGETRAASASTDCELLPGSNKTNPVAPDMIDVACSGRRSEGCVAGSWSDDSQRIGEVGAGTNAKRKKPVASLLD